MDIDPHKRADIVACLEAIAARENVRLLFAIESGSRAWGHPSPDSDYDVRFVYVRPLEWYVSLAPGRDVIERPIVDDLDLNGWDLRKALSLLMKPNPVLLEWLSSPIRYVWDEAVCEKLSAFARSTAHARACLHHYARLAARQNREHLEGRDVVNLKKYFYVLRPALALRWLRRRPGTIPPMNLQELMDGVGLDRAMTEDIHRLIAIKAEARESGHGPRVPSLDALIAQEIAAAEAPADPGPDRSAEADALFRSIVMPGGG